MSSPSPSLPPRPRLVLRLGFAGRRELSGEEYSVLGAALDAVLAAMGGCLEAMAPGTRGNRQGLSPVTDYYSDECPLLRLVTGLCEGGDAAAAQALERLRVPGAEGKNCLATELGAVLPFDAVTYRDSRAPEFRGEYDEHLSRCAWVLELDGICEKPEPDTKRAKNRRARAYRAQSAFLLRHSDILIAAANPDDTGKAGGTLETVQQALVFDLPVVFIHTGKPKAEEAVFLIEPGDSLHNVLAGTAPTPEKLAKGLKKWIHQLTADPDRSAGEAPGAHGGRKDGRKLTLLEEFFDDAGSPAKAEARWLVRCRKQAWKWFENRFKSGESPKADPKLAPFSDYRKRATALNYHYTGLYRGAFLLNYLLAIIAVALAAVSLTLIGTSAHTPLGRDMAGVLTATGKLPPETGLTTTAPRPWLLPVLLALAAGKLGILIVISRNTRIANREKWNDRAVDTRYLAERLRGMYYLPHAGSHQPPAAAPPQFASRVVHQSAVDWLFDAIVRSVSPASLPSAEEAVIPAHDGQSTVTIRKRIRLNPAITLRSVQDDWIAGQLTYHESNSHTMHRIHHSLETVQKWLGWGVIGVVGLDVLLIGGKAFHLLPQGLVPFAKAATPWLIAVSAILPAVVAALSGIRFQSECQRLAERSSVVRNILSGRRDQVDKLVKLMAADAAHESGDPGSWSHEVLRITERVATDFVQEAAEWSVLYAKEVSDPG